LVNLQHFALSTVTLLLYLSALGCILFTLHRTTDSEGNEVTDSRGAGYRYFGAAKQLPGVKELFEKEAPKPVSC
jgi:hypothetical protein